MWSIRFPFRTTHCNEKGEHAVRAGVVGFDGTALLGDGRVLMVLDPKGLP